MTADEPSLTLLRSKLRDVPDFPTPGILFKDITPLLSDHNAMDAALSRLAQAVENLMFDVIAAPEARGFIFAAPLARHFSVGLALIRKPGKLPAATLSHTYSLEYGNNTLEMHADSFEGMDSPRVLIVDDVLATGGTAAASAELIRSAGGVPVGLAVLVELAALNGRKTLSDMTVRSVLSY
ncbi:MAG: adenine phosphoribosyltransferase [Pseudomonadota bacterium]|nr:adenine phosphoribosyltransferase [Pseudomonadota bacterium]